MLSVLYRRFRFVRFGVRGGKSRVHDRIPVKQRWYNNHNYDDRSVHFSFSHHFHHSSQVKSDISILQNSSKSIRYKSAKNNSVCFISCSAMGRREKIFSILPTTTVVPKQTEAHYLQRVLGLMFCRSEQPVRPCVFVLTRADTYAAVMVQSVVHLPSVYGSVQRSVHRHTPPSPGSVSLETRRG